MDCQRGHHDLSVGRPDRDAEVATCEPQSIRVAFLAYPERPSVAEALVGDAIVQDHRGRPGRCKLQCYV